MINWTNHILLDVISNQLKIFSFSFDVGTMPYDDTNKNAQIVSMRKGATFTRSKQKLSLECHVAIRMILNPDVAKRATIETIEESKWCKMMSYKLGKNFVF